MGDLAVNVTAGSSGLTISPHPSSHEGHRSTARWISELNAVGQELDVRKRLDTFTVEFSGLSGQAFADFARKERETLAPIIEKANIKLN